MVRITYLVAVFLSISCVSVSVAAFHEADGYAVDELDRYVLEVFERHDAEYALAGANTELVGAIFERNGRLDAFPMQVVAANRPWRIRIPVGGRFVALLHTHPPTTRQEGFSGGRSGDVGLFFRRGHPQASYVRLPSGRVRKLTSRMARTATGRWTPGIPVCDDDQPCLSSFAKLWSRYAEK